MGYENNYNRSNSSKMWDPLNSYEQIITFQIVFEIIIPPSFQRLFLCVIKWLSHLIPILVTTSQCLCFPLTPQVLCHFFLQKGQQVCILIPISNDTIQWNESLKMSWWHQYMWSFFAHLFFIVFNEWAGVNHKDCEHCHHFCLLGVKTFFELHLFLWMAIIEIPQ